MRGPFIFDDMTVRVGARLLAHIMGVDPSDITYTNAEYRVNGMRLVSFHTLDWQHLEASFCEAIQAYKRSLEHTVAGYCYHAPQCRRYQPSVADEALYLALIADHVIGAIEQAYAKGDLASVETYNTLFEAARKVYGAALKLHTRLGG